MTSSLHVLPFPVDALPSPLCCDPTPPYKSFHTSPLYNYAFSRNAAAICASSFFLSPLLRVPSAWNEYLCSGFLISAHGLHRPSTIGSRLTFSLTPPLFCFQDSHTAVTDLGSLPDHGLFAVFDGHGGSTASIYRSVSTCCSHETHAFYQHGCYGCTTATVAVAWHDTYTAASLPPSTLSPVGSIFRPPSWAIKLSRTRTQYVVCNPAPAPRLFSRFSHPSSSSPRHL